MNMNNSVNNESKENVKPVRTKLYVSNFPPNSTRRSLTEFFSKFGQVLECAIMWDKYAFIHYGTMEEAQNAVRKANSMYFMGQKLFIQLSTSKNRQSNNWYQQEAEKLLAKANELNLSQNGNLIETKLYVTNLPDNCDQQELKTLFEEYGEVLECVIMWNHYAFIHFSDFNEAKVALENLHGSVFNGKRLLVQLSTSSNRPLPKCLAFSKKNGKNESSILTCNSTDEEKNDSLLLNGQKSENDWIQKLKNGNVPVVGKINDEKKFDVGKFFNSFKSECVNLSNLPIPKIPLFTFNKTNKNLNNFNCFDSIPTPPMPIVSDTNTNVSATNCSSNTTIPTTTTNNNNNNNNNDNKIQDNDCIRKLIDDINLSSIDLDDFNFGDQTRNEKILIDRLNLLKFDLDSDSKLRNLWNTANETDSTNSLISCSSSGVSSSSSVRSLSPPYSTFSINYLNKNCVFEENILKNYDAFNFKNDRQNFTKQKKKSRCRLVNYLLFPEVKEENFSYISDYNNILIELIKKNCIID